MGHKMTYSTKAAAFLAMNPTHLGTIANRKYYESPTHGDESPMFYIEDGKLRKSEFWDMESAQDAMWNNFN